MTPDKYWANQRYFDNLHYDLISTYRPSGSEQSRRIEYVEQVNLCWNCIDPKYIPSLQRRKDRRTLGQFALQVHDTTLREHFLVDEWRKIIGRGIIIHNHAIGNDGRLILDQSSMDGRPDYWVESSKGDFKLEVKFNPCQWKMTFKVCDLKAYARVDAQVLIIMGDAGMIGPNGQIHSDKKLFIPRGLQWCLFDKATIRLMLSKIPQKEHREMGYKRSIQLKQNDIAKYMKVKSW